METSEIKWVAPSYQKANNKLQTPTIKYKKMKRKINAENLPSDRNAREEPRIDKQSLRKRPKTLAIKELSDSTGVFWLSAISYSNM